MGKMTDGDVMIYIRNHALAISKMAKEHDIDIEITAHSDGYINCKANNDYEFSSFDDGYEAYNYWPTKSNRKWRYDIKPQSIKFSGAPYTKRGGMK